MVSNKQNRRWLIWIKKIGFWGFIFFLVKGLLWLAFGYWFLKA
jgi:hypothetical protein